MAPQHPDLSRYAGVVLAAGASRRMGRTKALLRNRDGMPFVAAILRTFRDAGLSRALVVGREDDEVIAVVAAIVPPVRYVVNSNPERGQLSSLVTAIDAVEADGVEAIVVLPVDMPLVRASTLVALCETSARAEGAQIVRPVYHGNHGHPVIFRRGIFDALRHADPAVGARAVVRSHPDLVRDVVVDDPGVTRDFDLPSDLAILDTCQ